MSWLAYFFYFSAATAAPIQRRWLAVRKEGGNKIDLSFKVYFIGALPTLIFPFFSPFELHGSYATLILLSAVAGIALTVYSICYYTAQGHVEAGTTSVLSNFYTPVTIVLSTFFLKEKLHGLQILGAIILILAAVIVSKKHRTGKVSFDKHFWLMILAGFFLSIFLIANTELMRMTGFTASTILSWWAACAGLGILKLFSLGKTTYTRRDLVTTGSFKFLENLSWTILVYVVANLSVVSAVTTFKVVLIFFFAAFFLREREDLGRKVLGSAIAVAGLFLMR